MDFDLFKLIEQVGYIDKNLKERREMMNTIGILVSNIKSFTVADIRKVNNPVVIDLVELIKLHDYLKTLNNYK